MTDFAKIASSSFSSTADAWTSQGVKSPSATSESLRIDDFAIDAGERSEERPSFADVLADGIREVANRQMEAKDSVANFAAGKGEGVHDVMLAMGKSQIAFSMMLEVRNRLVDAWREVTRIQV